MWGKFADQLVEKGQIIAVRNGRTSQFEGTCLNVSDFNSGESILTINPEDEARYTELKEQFEDHY